MQNPAAHQVKEDLSDQHAALETKKDPGQLRDGAIPEVQKYPSRKQVALGAKRSSS